MAGWECSCFPDAPRRAVNPRPVYREGATKRTAPCFRGKRTASQARFLFGVFLDDSQPLLGIQESLGQA